jgi:hypothetical protein
MRDCTRVTAAIRVTTNCQHDRSVALARAYVHISGEGCVVAVVNSESWRSNLYADPHVIGSLIHADGHVVKVIGIMPPTLLFRPSASPGPSCVCPDLPLPLPEGRADSTHSESHSTQYSSHTPATRLLMMMHHGQCAWI